jgi:hypothetical protein
MFRLSSLGESPEFKKRMGESMDAEKLSVLMVEVG